MPTIQTGRQGYVGFAIQSDIDTPNTTPDVYIPFTEFSLQGKHEPQGVTHAVANRIMDVSSVEGRKWSEGNIAVDLDIVNSGYLFFLFAGNEGLVAGTPNSHNFYITVSGNTPAFATIIQNFGDVEVKQMNAVCANTLAINVADGLATMTMGLMGKFPVAGNSQTPTTLSGTVFNFTRFQLQLGTTLANADGAAPTPVQEWTMEANNNIFMVHSSRSSDGTNSNDVRTFRLGNIEVTGTYRIFFDSTTERDNYLNHIKRAMIAEFSQGSLETLTIKFAKVRYEDQEVETGIDDLYAINTTYRAELDTSQVPNLVDITLQNDKSTAYNS